MATTTGPNPTRAIWAGAALTVAGYLSTSSRTSAISLSNAGRISDHIQYGLTSDYDLTKYLTASAILIIGGVITLFAGIAWAAAKDNPGPLPRIVSILGGAVGVYFAIIAIAVDHPYGSGLVQIASWALALVGAGLSLSILRQPSAPSSDAEKSSESGASKSFVTDAE